MTYALAPGISFCDTVGQRIFLSVRQDRYFSLGEGANRSFTRLMDAEPLTDADRDRLDYLVGAGVLCETAVLSRPSPCHASPARSALLDNRALPTAATLRSVAAAVRLKRAKKAVRRVPLDRLCAKFIATKSDECGRASTQGVDIAALAVAFQAAARLVGALDQCLALSLALGHQALRMGLPVDLLLGVRTRPFHAHAWVEIDGVILTDRFDNIRPYVPILVL